ncbi:MAG: hypothetical protein ACI87E_003820 [Mariniblastus sp.]|jgi:hypothetical protein
MQILFYIWTFPNSLIGLSIGAIGLLSGGKIQRRRGCLEFYGGFVTWFLAKCSSHGVSAMTLGHTIIGQTQRELHQARDHEQVHVSQYERWGPLFIPVYLSFSCYLWFAKRNCYLENPFEVEAYRIADPRIPTVKPDE